MESIQNERRKAESQKPSTLERNNQKWDSMKMDIYRIYVDDKSTLEATMSQIEELHGFNARWVYFPSSTAI